MSQTSTLRAIKNEIADRLIVEEWFRGIAVFTEEIGDIESQVAIAVGSIGTCVIVISPTGEVADINASGPQMSPVNIVLRVVENVIVNQSPTGTSKHAMDTLSVAMRALHLFVPHSSDSSVVGLRFKLVEHPNSIIYDFELSTAVMNEPNYQAVERPVVEVSSGEVSITCATPGAQIAYTVNDLNRPATASLVPGLFSSITHGTPYSAPFSVSAGAKVIARAWKEGFATSDAVTVTVT